MTTTECNAILAELAATIPPHLRRLEAVEAELHGAALDRLRKAVDAEVCLLIELMREQRGGFFG